MKRLICLLILILVGWIFVPPAKAPKNTNSCFLILAGEPIYILNIKDPVLRAFVWFESRFIEDIVNPVSGARGILQILPPMIKRANSILELQGSNLRYTWDDAFNAKKSIEIWYLVQNYLNPTYDVRKACQIWFGIGTQYDGLTWIGYEREILILLNS